MKRDTPVSRARVTVGGARLASCVAAIAAMSPLISRTLDSQGVGSRSNVSSVTLVATKLETPPGVTVVRWALDQIGPETAGAVRVSVDLGPDARGVALHVRDARGRMRPLRSGQPVSVCESAATCERASIEFRQLSQEPVGHHDVPLRVVYRLQFTTAAGQHDVFLPHELLLTSAPFRAPAAR